MKFDEIKNIVFDLGGVIINLDFQKTYRAFADLAGITLEETVNLFQKNEYFRKYETGQLQEKEFFSWLQSSFCPDASFDQIETAWNALLLDIPATRIDLIQALRGKYNLILLSNTNDTHIRKVNEILLDTTGIRKLDMLFDTIYYSYEIGLAKPEKTIYEFVGKESALNPAETVFLDDTLLNLGGAEQVGWKTLHVTHPLTILELLNDAR